MAAHQALYRKWRPQTFSDVVGQGYAIQTLLNAIAGNEVGHAYLFAGPRGTGKTTVARLFSKAVNCQNNQRGEPCNACDACQRIARGAVLDVVEIDGASNRGIDQIRKLREEVNFVPADVANKVYIIDEVHMLTNEAFNALLKTLEEPPKRVIFIFATTEINKLPATVTSRCQAFEFTRISPDDMFARLHHIAETEAFHFEDDALTTIAARSGGALRDALVTLEQVAAYAQGKTIDGDTLESVLGLPSASLLQQFMQAMLSGDAPAILTLIEDLSNRGQDLELFLEELIRTGRNWLIDIVSKKSPPIKASPPELAGLTQHLLALKRDMGRSWDKRILLEVGVMQWLHQDTQSVSVASRPSQMNPKSKTESAVQPTPAAPPPPPQTRQEAVSKAPQQSAPTSPSPNASQADSDSVSSGEDENEAPIKSAPSTNAPIQLEQAWQRLLNNIRDDRIAVYAYLVEGHPQFEQDTLTLLYRPGHQFHKESLEKEDVMQYVLGKARPIFGERVDIRLGFTENGHPKDNPEDAPAPTAAPDESDTLLDEKAALVKHVLGADPND